ncbi:hypothetical protein [Sphingobacterium sp. MYb382]|uniref:hypothetical protein n=1 Tax=Sphingobacterium sp. MYb382 TaxID=2745278 RepID=UPI0030B7D0F0
MLTGVFITARLGSSRLKQKHLIKANGFTFLEWLIKRMEFEFSSELLAGNVHIFIVTSDLEENRQFEVFSNNYVQIFYGADDNIPLRHLQCAKANGVDNILSIDGDDILCSPAAARLVFESLSITNNVLAKTSGLSLGMNVFGYKTSYLEEVIQGLENSTLETGWGRIFDMKKADDLLLVSPIGYEKLRMTLDYDKDAVFFQKVIESIGNAIIEIDDFALVSTVIQNQWNDINDELSEEYWNNFKKQQKEEN